MISMCPSMLARICLRFWCYCVENCPKHCLYTNLVIIQIWNLIGDTQVWYSWRPSGEIYKSSYAVKTDHHRAYGHVNVHIDDTTNYYFSQVIWNINDSLQIGHFVVSLQIGTFKLYEGICCTYQIYHCKQRPCVDGVGYGHLVYVQRFYLPSMLSICHVKSSYIVILDYYMVIIKLIVKG